jgi:hypothetical protein
VCLPGEVYGTLTILEESEKNRHGHRRVVCRCRCGKIRTVPVMKLRDGRVSHCGCLTDSHGMTGTPEHRAWLSMNGRCHTTTSRGYANYGGRGITVCEEWRRSFRSFYDHVGPRPSSSHSVDRIDNERGYEPGNVRWALPRQQMRNTRRVHLLAHDGVTMTIVEWEEKLGIKQRTILMRIRSGWTTDQALTRSVRKYDRKATR